MTLEDLLPELLKLNRGDKLRAIQVLAHEVATEDSARLTPGAHYEIWSPYDSATTARELMEMLNEDQTSAND